jgi:hypothetical protein
MNKPIDARNATHVQIRDWLAISAMMRVIEAQLSALDAMHYTYPEIKAALENALATMKPYSAREEMNVYRAHLLPYAFRPRPPQGQIPP